ncbi:MAG: 4Fe-4S binding protein [Eubacteriales bacterium]|nr:4Fe-4S binding protein [Eubacteriales bacterium]
MNIFEITFSPTGGTDKISGMIMKEAAGNHKKISLLSNTTDYHAYSFDEEDVCVISVPSYGGRVPDVAVQRISAMNGNKARVILVSVYGNRAYDDTLMELKETVKKAGFIPIAAIAAIAEHSIMRQYAAGRPDSADEREIRRFAEIIWTKIQSGEVTNEVKVPGNETYREYHGVPLKPKAGKACNQCGACATQCPVGAIDSKNPKITDKYKCISCMRCVSICPKHARKLNRLMLTVASRKMAKACENRKDNEFFMN